MCANAIVLQLSEPGFLPGKPGILLFTFPSMENALNLLKNWENPGILTQNLEKY